MIDLNILGAGFNVDNLIAPTLIVLVALWEVVWKGIGMWYAARADHKGWFIAILVFNTIGILPIAYLLIQRNNTKTPITPSTEEEPAI